MVSPWGKTLLAAEPLACTLGRDELAQSKRRWGLLWFRGICTPPHALAGLKVWPVTRAAHGSATAVALCCYRRGSCVPKTELGLLCSYIKR